MRDYLRQILAGARGDAGGTRLVREYLQARMLQGLQEAGAFTDWAFLGGTALRFLYSIPRFSEDLDFSLERRGGAVDFERAIERCRLFWNRGRSGSAELVVGRASACW